MTTIWKYVLRPDAPVVTMPAKAQVLCAREQHGDICIWAEVRPDEPRMEDRLFAVYATGQEIKDEIPRKYIGTVHLMGGQLIFHVFEVMA